MPACVALWLLHAKQLAWPGNPSLLPELLPVRTQPAGTLPVGDSPAGGPAPESATVCPRWVSYRSAEGSSTSKSEAM